MPGDDPNPVERMREFCSRVREREQGEIQVEFIVQIARSKTPETVDERADRILALHEAGLVVGVAIAGEEQGNPVKPFRRTLARLRDAGLGIEIHAGEWCGPESVWDALEYGSPDRIGHGIAIFDDANLIRQFQDERIHIEMCPTSNVKTGSVPRLSDHPIRRAFDLGLNVGISTDDPGAFECSVASEYKLVAERFGFSDAEMRQLRDNALDARFQRNLRVAVP